MLSIQQLLYVFYYNFEYKVHLSLVPFVRSPPLPPYVVPTICSDGLTRII